MYFTSDVGSGSFGSFGKSISTTEGTVKTEDRGSTLATRWEGFSRWPASPDPLSIRLKVRLIVDIERWVVSGHV